MMEIAILVLTSISTLTLGAMGFAVWKGAQGLKKFKSGPMGGMLK